MRRAIRFLLFFAIAVACAFQPSARAQATKSLPVAFQYLVGRYDPKVAAYEDNALKVADLVPTASPEEVSRTLPEIQIAISQQDETIKKFGAYILTIISFRPDSSHLLGEHVQEIAPLLNEKDAHLQQEAVLVLGGMKPISPRSVVPPLLDFVHRTDRDPIAQVNAISVLLRLAPADVAPGLKRFASRILDSPAKEALANAIANSKTDDSEAADVLIALLDDSDEQVRFQAAQAFQRMPTKSVARARAALNERRTSPEESQEVKEAAMQALTTLEN
ncbi:MAG: HEAT repeat domain-containing protein [Candidatus Sulfotelmatobacter sp.]